MRRDVFQVIAAPVRRDILALIAKSLKTPNAVADCFPVRRPAVSEHLKILMECGFLAREVRGREYYYNIQPHKLVEVNNWLAPCRQMWAARFNQLDNLLNSSKTNENGK